MAQIQHAARFAMILSGVGAVAFGYVAIHEWEYVASHKYYGPAEVIAWCGIGGFLVCFAVAWLAYTVRDYLATPQSPQ
jgi:hypothetical protein